MNARTKGRKVALNVEREGDPSRIAATKSGLHGQVALNVARDGDRHSGGGARS